MDHALRAHRRGIDEARQVGDPAAAPGAWGLVAPGASAGGVLDPLPAKEEGAQGPEFPEVPGTGRPLGAQLGVFCMFFVGSYSVSWRLNRCFFGGKWNQKTSKIVEAFGWPKYLATKPNPYAEKDRTKKLQLLDIVIIGDFSVEPCGKKHN